MSVKTRVAVSLSAVIVLAGCATPAAAPEASQDLGATVITDTDTDTGPDADRGFDVIESSSVSTTDVSGLAPEGYQVTRVLDLDRDPMVVGEQFISMRIPRSGEHDDLRFTAFDETGVTWQIGTNPSCVGTVLDPREGDGTIVILDSSAVSSVTEAGQDLASSNNASSNSRLDTKAVATKFATSDASILWGPAEISGADMGLGLLFVQNAAPTLDFVPQLAAFKHTDGTPAQIPEQLHDWDALYEYSGYVLLTSDTETNDELAAVDTDSGEVLWQRSHAGTMQVHAHEASGTIVPIHVQDPDDVTIFLNLETGDLLGHAPPPSYAESSAQAIIKHYEDAATGDSYFMIPTPQGYTLVAFNDNEMLSQGAWELPEQIEHFAVFGNRMFVQTSDSGYILDISVDEGQAAFTEVAEGTGFVVPMAFNANGTAVAYIAAEQAYVMLEPQESQ